MKFKCNISGCVYSFASPLDNASMLKSQDYTVVVEEVLAQPTKVAPVSPVALAPDKPLAPAPVASKTV